VAAFATPGHLQQALPTDSFLPWGLQGWGEKKGRQGQRAEGRGQGPGEAGWTGPLPPSRTSMADRPAAVCSGGGASSRLQTHTLRGFQLFMGTRKSCLSAESGL
jgi:hypothetical protein